MLSVGCTHVQPALQLLTPSPSPFLHEKSKKKGGGSLQELAPVCYKHMLWIHIIHPLGGPETSLMHPEQIASLCWCTQYSGHS